MSEKFTMPKPDVEYILTYDAPIDFREAKGFLKRGTIVNNVTYNSEFGCMDYVVKETGLKQHTYYPWALAENTPENVERMKEEDAQQVIVNREEQKLIKLRRNVSTLMLREEFDPTKDKSVSDRVVQNLDRGII